MYYNAQCKLHDSDYHTSKHVMHVDNFTLQLRCHLPDNHSLTLVHNLEQKSNSCQ